jgi:Family of unknown function (DUF6220)
MAAARAAHRYLLTLFIVGVAVQFFLAGLGVFRVQDGASDSRFEDVFSPHRTLGNILFILGLLVLLAAIVARLGRARILAMLVLPILVFLQSVLANNGPSWFRALHVLNAFVIAGFAGTMTGRYWAEYRVSSAE